MRNWLLIFLAFAAYLLLCSKSCDSGHKDDAQMQKTRLTKTKALIRAEAESETLSDQSLRAYEVKAKQKLVDFADYLSIYYDKSLDQAMKDQARLMIADLFPSEDIILSPIIKGGKMAGKFTLGELLSEDYLPEYPSTKILIDSMAVCEPLKYAGESVYTGAITFYYRVKSVSGNDTLVSEKVKMETEILAKRINKSFGADTLKVWSVFLGNISMVKPG
jgi:hypothetical protein